MESIISTLALVVDLAWYGDTVCINWNVTGRKSVTNDMREICAGDDDGRRRCMKVVVKTRERYVLGVTMSQVERSCSLVWGSTQEAHNSPPSHPVCTHITTDAYN